MSGLNEFIISDKGEVTDPVHETQVVGLLNEIWDFHFITLINVLLQHGNFVLLTKEERGIIDWSEIDGKHDINLFNP